MKPNKVTFKSHLLGGFGVGFVTPVNLIDFNRVFRDFGKRLLSNPCVWATIIVTIVLYVLFAVIARRLDKKDALKVTAFHLLILTSTTITQLRRFTIGFNFHLQFFCNGSSSTHSILQSLKELQSISILNQIKNCYFPIAVDSMGTFEAI